MGSQTSVWDLRYPDSTDDVRVYEDVKNLADDTEAALNALQALIPVWSKRAERTTDGTATTTTEQPYLRLDSVPIVTGKGIRIWCPPMIFDSTVAGDLIQAVIRVSTSGAATISSTALTVLAQRAYSAAGNQETVGLSIPYIPATTGNLSILLSYVRAGGTGNVRIRAVSSIPAQINVDQYNGTAPANTGVSL